MLEHEEVVQQSGWIPAGDCSAGEDGHPWPAAYPGDNGQVAVAVGIEVPNRRPRPAAEVPVVDAKEADQLPKAAARVHVHPGTARLVRRDGDFGDAVAIDVTGRDEPAALEGILKGQLLPHQLAVCATVRLDDHREAGARGTHDVGHGIAGHVRHGHPNAAGERRPVRCEIQSAAAVGVEHLDRRGHPRVRPGGRQPHGRPGRPECGRERRWQDRRVHGWENHRGRDLEL